MIRQLTGYGLSLKVDSGKLVITNGVNSEHTQQERTVYKPHEVNFDQIVVYGQSGNITLSAIKWLAKQNIMVSVLNWDGRLLTQMNPPQSKRTDIRQLQYKAYDSPERLIIAKAFIQAKLQNTQAVMLWLLQRYPQLKEEYDLCDFKGSFKRLQQAKSPKQIMTVEGFVSNYYWQALGKTFPLKFEFEKRTVGDTGRPLGAVDCINAVFNYSYAVLESQCHRAINSANLDCCLGFLHTPQTGKESLAYDLQEPYRWLIDVTVIKALETNLFFKKDFILGDSFHVKLREQASDKLLPLLNQAFNEMVLYKGKQYKWSTVIEGKAEELAKYLAGSQKSINFTQPQPELTRVDNEQIRQKIGSISYKTWLSDKNFLLTH